MQAELHLLSQWKRKGLEEEQGRSNYGGVEERLCKAQLASIIIYRFPDQVEHSPLRLVAN